MAKRKQVPDGWFKRRKRRIVKYLKKEDLTGLFYMILFGAIGLGTLAYAGDLMVSTRVEVQGKVVSRWYRQGTWDPRTNTMRQDYYFIRAETELGTYDFDAVRTTYMDTHEGERVSCIVGKGLLRNHPISCGRR